MCAETLPPVAHPSFTEITDCPLQLQKDGILGLVQCPERRISKPSMHLSILSLSGFIPGEQDSTKQPVSNQAIAGFFCYLFLKFNTHFCRIKENEK